MRTTALMIALGLVGSALGDSAVCHLSHVRPSTFVAIMHGGQPRPRWYRPFTTPSDESRFLSGGGIVTAITGVQADDDASTITVEGSKEAIAEFKKILAEFDVAPRKVIAHVVIRSRLDKLESKADLEITNNASVRHADEISGLKLQLTPRINGNDTMTVNFDISTDSIDSYFPLLIDKDATVEFGVDDKGVTWDGQARWIDARTFSPGRFATPQPKHEKPHADLRVSVRMEMENPLPTGARSVKENLQYGPHSSSLSFQSPWTTPPESQFSWTNSELVFSVPEADVGYVSSVFLKSKIGHFMGGGLGFYDLRVPAQDYGDAFKLVLGDKRLRAILRRHLDTLDAVEVAGKHNHGLAPGILANYSRRDQDERWDRLAQIAACMQEIEKIPTVFRDYLSQDDLAETLRLVRAIASYPDDIVAESERIFYISSFKSHYPSIHAEGVLYILNRCLFWVPETLRVWDYQMPLLDLSRLKNVNTQFSAIFPWEIVNGRLSLVGHIMFIRAWANYDPHEEFRDFRFMFGRRPTEQYGLGKPVSVTTFHGARGYRDPRARAGGGLACTMRDRARADLNLVKRSTVWEAVTNRQARWTRLHEACKHPERLKEFLASLRQTANVNLSSTGGMTALHVLSLNYDTRRFGFVVREAQALLAKGASVDMADDERSTALHCACSVGDLPLCRLLVKRGASVRAKRRNGYTPLLIACLHVSAANTSIVALLLSSGANPNVRLPDGRTPIELAIEPGPGRGR